MLLLPCLASFSGEEAVRNHLFLLSGEENEDGHWGPHCKEDRRSLQDHFGASCCLCSDTTQLNEQNFQMSSIFIPIKLRLQSTNQTGPWPMRQESSVALGSSWLKITVDKGSRKGWSQDTVLSDATGLRRQETVVDARPRAWTPTKLLGIHSQGLWKGTWVGVKENCFIYHDIVLSESARTLNSLILGHTWPESRFYLLAAGHPISLSVS